MTEENEELYDDWTNDVTEYYDDDWMDWIGALTDDWSYGFDSTMTGHSWIGMMTQTGMTMVGLTTGPGVLEVTPLELQLCPSLSNQLHPAALPRAQLVSLVCSPAKPHPHQTCQHFTQL